MKWVAGGLALGVMVLLAGCASPAGGQGAAASGEKTGQLGKVQKQAEEMVVPPADAAWTILCGQFKGAGHVESAKVFKQQIAAKTGWKDFYLVHQDDVSTLYYGFYRSISPRGEDAEEGRRAQDDLARVRSLQNTVGDPLFRMAGMSPLEPADPAAPPEWDLRNVDRNKLDSDPTKAYYTLEIAIYHDSPLRKQAAVESVQALRESGVKDAYFYHGKTSSSVCIGTWPESAVVMQEPERGSSDERILVMPQGMPAGMSPTIRDSEGHTVRAVSLKPVPVDPTLLDTMAKYPRRSVNGFDIKHTYKLRAGGTVDRFDPSMLIFIPHDEKPGLGSIERDSMINNNGAAPTLPSPEPVGGQLRSLDSGAGQ